MHSFHHSRGRILFGALCALVISASLLGAWMQTAASALLVAATVSALYGLVHLFDVRRPLPAVADAQPVAVDHQLETSSVTEDPQLVEPAAPQPKAERKAKAPRKGGGRRASAPRNTTVTEPAPPAEVETTEFAPMEAEVAVLSPPGDVSHSQIEPLFEPEPFVRMPRRAFGRKAG